MSAFFVKSYGGKVIGRLHVLISNFTLNVLRASRIDAEPQERVFIMNIKRKDAKYIDDDRPWTKTEKDEKELEMVYKSRQFSNILKLYFF